MLALNTILAATLIAPNDHCYTQEWFPSVHNIKVDEDKGCQYCKAHQGWFHCLRTNIFHILHDHPLTPAACYHCPISLFVHVKSCHKHQTPQKAKLNLDNIFTIFLQQTKTDQGLNLVHHAAIFPVAFTFLCKGSSENTSLGKKKKNIPTKWKLIPRQPGNITKHDPVAAYAHICIKLCFTVHWLHGKKKNLQAQTFRKKPHFVFHVNTKRNFVPKAEPEFSTLEIVHPEITNCSSRHIKQIMKSI